MSEKKQAGSDAPVRLDRRVPRSATDPFENPTPFEELLGGT